MNEEHWLTVEEAAHRLKLTTRATHRYREQKRVKTKRVGRRTLFYESDIEQLAKELGAANKPTPTPKTGPDLTFDNDGDWVGVSDLCLTFAQE